jgi:hypothetical protein
MNTQEVRATVGGNGTDGATADPFPEARLKSDKSILFHSPHPAHYHYMLVHFLDDSTGAVYINRRRVRPDGAAHYYEQFGSGMDYDIEVHHPDGNAVTLIEKAVTAVKGMWVKRFHTGPGGPEVGITVVMQDDAVAPHESPSKS